MKSSNTTKQQAFFDKSDNQYQSNGIIHPPFHTQLELSYFLKKLQSIKTPLNILDFGAGSGRVTIYLLQNKFTVTAFDISKKSLKNLLDLTRHLSLPLPTTATSWPKNKKFKVIVGADILHHVVLEDSLVQTFNSLEKNGQIIFSEPGALNISWYLYLPFASTWDVEKGMMQCTLLNLQSTLKKTGFRNIEITGIGLLPPPFLNWSKKLCLLNNALGNLPILKLFAYRYIIYAQK